MPSFQRLQLTDVIALSSALRAAGATSGSLEEAAGRMISALYDALLDDGEEQARACALARFYITQRYDQLDAELQGFADGLLGDHKALPATPCFALVASRGVEPAWNSRFTSAGHKAIPLLDDAWIEQLPMVAAVLRQLGVPTAALLSPTPEVIRSLQLRQCGTFLVEEAEGSPIIPAQDFVQTYGVQSVLGFGGMLPDGELFVTLLFSRILLERPIADAFAALSLGMKLSLLPYSGARVFA